MHRVVKDSFYGTRELVLAGAWMSALEDGHDSQAQCQQSALERQVIVA